MALALDPRTKLVSPQYHVVFDDSFSTVDHLKNNTTPPNWEDLCCNHTEFFVDNFNEATLLGEINSALGDTPGIATAPSTSDNMLSAPPTDLASTNNLSEGDLEVDQLKLDSSEGDLILEPENHDINPILPEGDTNNIQSEGDPPLHFNPTDQMPNTTSEEDTSNITFSEGAQQTNGPTVQYPHMIRN